MCIGMMSGWPKRCVVMADDPAKQVSARPVTWTIWGLAATLPILFGLLVMQLVALTPERYCGIVKGTGVPAGDFCFQLLMRGLEIRGYAIYYLIATIAVSFVIVLVAAVGAVVKLVGPNGWGADIGAMPRSDDI